MKIVSAEFVKSAFEEADWPRDQKPEIAFLGRSNVGKSSLMNSLLGVRGLARTSSTPGRTQAVNFFLINEKFRFVDLPGYGYARAPKDVKAKWNAAATDYLASRSQLVLSIHLVDARHEPTKQDLQLHEWLQHHDRRHLVVATKSDKLSNNELRKNTSSAKRLLESEILPFSAVTGRGREELWRAIEGALKQSKPE
ncbi:MAG TPA: ribosome biogenesis GTP-binding protein YihA/YsxC [Pyrinomonadaceae bacterium]|nr:ribosome biogenesis GTP-binding protein YihA/YsxC [Pyrinomonadaceae bacterium]